MMIKKLRRKFIWVTMISVFGVLVIIMTAINAVNYAKIATYADNVLNILYENNGRFVLSDNEDGPMADNSQEDINSSDKQQLPLKPHEGFREETPYETRYFTVKYEDSVVNTDVRNIAAVSSAQAIYLAEEALENGKKRGYIGIYRFLVADNGSFILFVDCAKQRDTANDFLIASLWISAIGLAAVFILVLILSKYAVKPIAESYEKQKRFITDASHELKTPLTIISANNELTELTSGETQATQAISKQLVRMTSMVKNLTALARLDETDVLLQSVDFSLTDTLIDMASLFCSSIENGQRKFYETIEKDLVLNGDETLIRQALSIIFENAAKYAETYVRLNASKNGKNITVELTNDAEGVSQGNLDRCFERFYRTDEARASDVSGNGIGLSIAKSIIELHKGTISASGSEEGAFQIKIVFQSAK